MKSIRGTRSAVLGGAGFIGSHLCEHLLAEGASSVVAVDNLITGSIENIRGLERDARFSYVQQDICEPFDLEGPFDFVFNLASPASPVDYARRWLETMRTGARGTENALLFAERKQAVFLQASTSEIYGDPLEHPQREDYRGNVDPTGPRAVYDEAKRFAEALVSAFQRERGLKARIVRIFNTYGPRMRLDDGRVVPTFIAQALRGEDLTVYGDGKQTRSFCYVSDLVDGIVALALSNVREPVNLGNPREMTVLELAEAVSRASGGTGRIVFKPLPEGDPRQRRPDITKARELLGWEPRVSLEEGLARTIEYFRARLAAPHRRG